MRSSGDKLSAFKNGNTIRLFNGGRHFTLCLHGLLRHWLCLNALYIYCGCSSLVKCYNSGKFLLMSMLERHIAYSTKLSRILMARPSNSFSFTEFLLIKIISYIHLSCSFWKTLDPLWHFNTVLRNDLDPSPLGQSA